MSGPLGTTPMLWKPFSFPAKVPGAPTIGTAIGGNASATVAFTAPGDNGGLPVTGYTATSNPSSITGSGATSPVAVSGLTNGTYYTFTVHATNFVGSGAESAASNSVLVATVPGAPTIGTAAAGVLGDATVTFTTPGSDGGAPILYYTVYSSPGGGTDITNDLSLSHTVTGLTTGVTYTFTVKATNVKGQGPASAASNSVVAGYSVHTILSAGSGNYTAPTGANHIWVEAIGGGGTGTTRGGGGGGFGGVYTLSVTGGSTVIYYNVGAAETDSWVNVGTNIAPSSIAHGCIGYAGHADAPGYGLGSAPQSGGGCAGGGGGGGAGTTGYGNTAYSSVGAQGGPGNFGTVYGYGGDTGVVGHSAGGGSGNGAAGGDGGVRITFYA